MIRCLSPQIGLWIGSQPSPAHAQERSTQAGSLTCMTTSTDRPRGGPAKDRETSGDKGVLKRRNRLLTDPFQRVLAGRQSRLHRIPKPRAEVRFLPGAQLRPQVSGLLGSGDAAGRVARRRGGDGRAVGVRPHAAVRRLGPVDAWRPRRGREGLAPRARRRMGQTTPQSLPAQLSAAHR